MGRPGFLNNFLGKNANTAPSSTVQPIIGVSGRKGATVNGWTTPLWNELIRLTYELWAYCCLQLLYDRRHSITTIDSATVGAESDCEVATDLSTSATQS
jgi:hypothetical protein